MAAANPVQFPDTSHMTSSQLRNYIKNAQNQSDLQLPPPPPVSNQPPAAIPVLSRSPATTGPGLTRGGRRGKKTQHRGKKSRRHHSKKSRRQK